MLDHTCRPTGGPLPLLGQHVGQTYIRLRWDAVFGDCHVVGRGLTLRNRHVRALLFSVIVLSGRCVKRLSLLKSALRALMLVSSRWSQSFLVLFQRILLLLHLGGLALGLESDEGRPSALGA